MPRAHALPPPKVRKEVRLTPAQLDRCVGRYEIAPGFVLTITRDSERLVSRATGQPTIEVFAESECEFFVRVKDTQLSFDLKDPKPAKTLVRHQGGRDTTPRASNS